MAFSISSHTFFTWINETLDKIIQKGGGRTRTPSSSVQRVVSRIYDAGFTRKITDRYSLLTDEMLDDYHDNLFAIGVLKTYIAQFPYSNTIEETLRNFGLRAKRAEEIQEIFEPLEGTCYTQQQIIDMAIEYLFGASYHTVGKKRTRHCIESENVDEWFLHQESGKQIYNFPGRCIPDYIERINNIIQNAYPPLDNYDYFYHTTNWHGGTCILKRINHNAGRTCLDFGLLGSFYVGPELKHAIEWAGVKQLLMKNEIAIMIFRIPKRKPSRIHYRELIGNEWRDITKKSRACIPPNSTLELEELQNLDLIYGPMVYNQDDVKNNGKNPTTHTPPKYQLASKSDNGDKFLHKCLLGGIFFQKWMG